MSQNHTSPPPPELRIVPTGNLLPHEEHDSQRSLPLIERLKHEDTVINPPIVAPMDGDQYVILDGANRCYAFSSLGYPHALVQVVRYNDGSVDLSTWQHVVCGWTEAEFIQHLRQLPDVAIAEGHNAGAIAHVQLTSGPLLALLSVVQSTHERNAALRHVVRVYQQNAILHRTATSDPRRVWDLFEKPVAMVSFPHYEPADIMAAAREQAFLPPGVSRHIVYGRAIRVNYPIEALKDPARTLAQKNDDLLMWTQAKMANRQIRYYAESTYQFDE